MIRSFFIFFLFLFAGFIVTSFLADNYGYAFSIKTEKETSVIEDKAWWKSAVNEMVNSQIVARGVADKRVIEVMKNIPRHLFVPNELERFAYVDSPLLIGHGQTISQPYIVALMTELLGLKGKEQVLEIGTGSGYQAAIISKLAKKCYTIEIVKELAESAKQKLKELGYKNVYVKWGDGYKGWKEQAPFDAIIVTAAPEDIPEELLKQLKVGGKMVIPVGDLETNSQELLVITKVKEGYKEEKIIPVRFVPMIKQ